MRRSICSFILLVVFICLPWLSVSAMAAVLNVPADYSTIQAAIDAASYGDTVLVSSGYYPEHIVLKSGIKVIGQGPDTTRISGGRSGSVVTAIDVTNAEFSGFQIYWAGNGGGEAGIKISGGNVVITNNKVWYNPRYGIYIVGGSSAIIRKNTIEHNGDTGNETSDYGLMVLHSSPLITNNFIVRNKEVGIYIGWEDSEGTRIINNTIVDNGYDGVWCYKSSPEIKNNIIVENSYGICAIYGAIPRISYNDVWGNSEDYNSQTGGVAAPGTGDISADPAFADNYYLNAESPCIDAGDPNPVYNDTDGTRNDMGAYGGADGEAGYAGSPVESGFVFTNIGKIPVSEIDQTLLSSHRGLVTVSDEVAQQLYIRHYKDAPFGGRLWISGLFGAADTSVRYYQILVAKWTGLKPPAPTEFRPLMDPLVKIKYIINSDGTVSTQRVSVGPKTINGVEGLYERTAVGYWAHRDLKIVWNTTWMADGLYDITYKAYSYGGYPFPMLNEVSLPRNDMDRITVRVDNSPVEASIDAVQDANGNEISVCSIVSLESNTEDLRFVITARHPHGFLRDYALTAHYGANSHAGTIVSDRFTNGHDSTPYWYGVSGVTFGAGDAFDAGMLIPWQNCAYHFHFEVWGRTTDGFNYIKRAYFDDHYYLQLHDNSCVGDFDGNGVVDGADLDLFSNDYGRDDCIE